MKSQINILYCQCEAKLRREISMKISSQPFEIFFIQELDGLGKAFKRIPGHVVGIKFRKIHWKNTVIIYLNSKLYLNFP